MVGATWPPPVEVKNKVASVERGGRAGVAFGGCVAPAEAQEIRSVIEEIAELQADAVGILEVVRVCGQRAEEGADIPARRCARNAAPAGVARPALLRHSGPLTRAEEPMNRFFYAHEIAKPKGVIPYLAQQERH